MKKTKPFVSILLPILNEADYISSTIKSVLAQNYPKNLTEVIIIDGMSDDGTREIIESCMSVDTRIKLIDNPKKIVSTALNLGIKEAKGDIIIRIDGHCELNNDFISKNIEILNEYPDVVSTGGPINHQGNSNLGKAIALAMSHPLGIGNAFHRYTNYEGYVEGAQFPALRASIFDKVGYFDENFVRNQDDEFNYRIKQSGGTIFISPRIKYKYFVRENYLSLFKQYLQYGFWRIPFLFKHNRFASLRQLVPSLFLLVCIFLVITGLYYKSLFVTIIFPLVYLLVIFFVTFFLFMKERKIIIIYFPWAIILMHIGYAFGFFYGIFKINSWYNSTHMSEISR